MSVGTALVASSLLQAGGQIYSGIQAQKAAASEASLMRQQAELASAEANREAEIKQDEAESFRKKQKMLFLKSGVAIEGSPLMILEETQRKSQEEVDAIRNRGYAQYTLGMKQAKQTFRAGRAALIGNTVSAMATIGTTYAYGKEQGLFSTTKGGSTNLSKLSNTQAKSLPTWIQSVRRT